MVKNNRNLLKVSMALFLMILMALPVSGLNFQDDGKLIKSEDATDDIPVEGIDETVDFLEERKGSNGLIELSDDEVEVLLNNFEGAPTRSEPWSEWERYSYHRGGEDGLIAYQSAENRVFIYGGGSSSWNNQQDYWSFSAYDDLFIYDFDDEKWYAVERYTSPGGRFGFSSAVDEANERFIIYGGYAGSMLDDLWEFDMETLEWTQLASSVFGSYYGRRGFAPMVLDTTGGVEHLYIHMGQEDDQYTYYVNNLTGFFRVDLTNPTATPTELEDGWTNDPDSLMPRSRHSMTIDESGRKIYIYGGMHMDGDDYVYLDDFWQYDIISGTWSELSRDPTMPLNYGARIFFRPTDDKVYLWGGRETSSGTGENETLWIYDTTLGSWERNDYYDIGTDVPNGRLLYHNHYSSDADRFFVFGGRYYSGNRNYRYRDISYMTLSNKAWTLVPNLNNPSPNTGGIFAYESDLNRLHYIGPNTYSDTVYTSYWDLAEEKWYSPNYNTGTENPRGRSNAGMCYDEENNTVYMYGGGYTTGWGSNRRYFTLGDMWKLDLSTYEWENIWDTANPGLRQNFDMVWNDNDGRIYFFGGRTYDPENPSSSQSTANNDFFSYIPGEDGGVFQPILTAGKPEIRYGAGAVFVKELNKMYITCGRDPNPTNTQDYRDLWEYDFSKVAWRELKSLTSPMIGPKLDYDPLTRELYLTGGDDYVIQRFRILENAWYSIDPDVNPGSMSGQAHLFIPETRDLWVYGGGIKPGIWKIGMPYRLSVQKVYFKDPEQGARDAYSMLRSYTFGTEVKTVNSPSDLSEVKISLLHRKGIYQIRYNSTQDEFTEVDVGDYAELTGSSVVWNDNTLTLEISVLFHWNFTSKANEIDKRISVDVNGLNVAPDFLNVMGILDVRNSLEIVGFPTFTGQYQGEVGKGDWVMTDEPISVTGPYVKYTEGIDLHPPVDTYTLMLSEGQYTQNNDNILLTEIFREWDLDVTPGESLDFTFNSPNSTYSNVTYILNMTGVDKEDMDIYQEFWLSVDGIAPSPPTSVMIHADAVDDSHTNFDDDLIVHLTWMGAGVSESGVKTHYWSFEDNGGTRNGNPIEGTEVEVTLPSNGTQTLYVWSEDNVGNIGEASNASILVDTELPVFTLVGPSLDQLIPYQVLEMEFNVSDPGGSKLNSLTLQYRFTNDGQDSEEMWNAEDAWKDMSELWTDFPKLYMQFDFTLGKDTPRLTDSDENFLQFRIKDYAGNEKESDIYNIRVDTDLRFPMVTLYGPDDGTIFEDAEDIELNWTLDFFLPEDVKYNLYIDEGEEGRKRVENQDPSVLIEITGLSFMPEFVTHGTWYWTIIPEAKGEKGNSTNGIKYFVFSNEASFSFDVEAEDDDIVRAQGTAGIPIGFRVTNTGQNSVIFDSLSYDIKGVGTLTWGSSSYEIVVGEVKDIKATLDISPATPVSNYTLVFYFNSTSNVKREVTIHLKVVEPIEEDGEVEDDDSNMGLYLIMGAISIIVILIIIALIYFTVVKKETTKRKVGEVEDDEFDELVGTGDGTSMAPVPTGLTTKPEMEEVRSGPAAPGEPQESEVVPKVDEHLTLAEEGSDDDWMNLVAKETIEQESKPEIIEEKVHHDEGKSLQDLLFDMSSDVDE